MQCQEKEESKIDEEQEDEKKRKELKKKIKLFKYVGETARSVYERSWEHVNSRDQLQTSSHMLKHILEEHEEEEQMEKIIFGVKVLRYTRNAFERQVRLTANLGNRELRRKAERRKRRKREE